MASVMLLLFGGVFALIGLGAVVIGANGFRRGWTMRRMDPSEMVVEPGLQEIEGRARAVDEPVTAPFTGSRSLICEYRVERYSHSDRGSNWDTVESGVDAVPVEVEHTGSTVAVDPENASRLLTREFRVDTATTDVLPPRVQEYADDTLDTGSTIELGPIEIGERRYRFTEERLDDGEEVYVLGPAERDPSSVPGGSGARLAIAPGERTWRQRLFGDPFVISDTSEKQATERQLKRAVGLFLFGLVFAGTGFAVIVLG